jgi:hypothetical protein
LIFKLTRIFISIAHSEKYCHPERSEGSLIERQMPGCSLRDSSAYGLRMTQDLFSG